MPTSKQNLQMLREKRDQMQAEVEALRNRMLGIELAIAMLESDGGDNGDGNERATSGRRTNVKATVIELLEETAATGLNAATTVEMASKRGISLDRGSVSSLLSRLKRDGVVDYDGDRYRLKEFSDRANRPRLISANGIMGDQLDCN